MSKQRRAVYVEWVDSMSKGGKVWHHIDEFTEDDLTCRSLGFIVKEGKKSIVISGHSSCAGSFAGDIEIPKCAITKRRALRLK